MNDDLVWRIVNALTAEMYHALLFPEESKKQLASVVQAVVSKDARIQTLERVAEAARADTRQRLDHMGGESMSFADAYATFPASDSVLALLEALAALETTQHG